MPADDRRRAGEVAERDRAQYALGLGDHVVVEEQDVVAGPGLDGLVHRAGEAAGAAEVALLDDAQFGAERRRGALEVRVVADAPGALVDDVDGVHHVQHLGCAAERDELVDAEARTVERGDAGLTRPCRTGADALTSAHQSARSRTASSSPARTSIQYQPPSMNGARVSRNATSRAVPESTRTESTRWTCPFAPDR